MRSLAKKPNEKLQTESGRSGIQDKAGKQQQNSPGFHISLLKRAIGPNQQPRPLPAALTEDHGFRCIQKLF